MQSHTPYTGDCKHTTSWNTTLQTHTKQDQKCVVFIKTPNIYILYHQLSISSIRDRDPHQGQGKWTPCLPPTTRLYSCFTSCTVQGPLGWEHCQQTCTRTRVPKTEPAKYSNQMMPQTSIKCHIKYIETKK